MTPSKKPGNTPPENQDDLLKRAHQICDEVLNSSQELLSAIEQEDITNLSQLLLRRGKMIDTLRALSINQIKGAERKALHDKMAKINKIEPTIQKGLKEITLSCDSKLKALRVQKVNIHQYRQTTEDKPSIHDSKA